MLTAYGVAAVREAEENAMAGAPEGALMQRAAEGLARHVGDRLTGRGRCLVLVLAGPGNNGGDALYAAAGLARRHDVAVVGIAATLHAGGEDAVRAAGVPVHPVDPGLEELPAPVPDLLDRADVVVDGLLGIGARPGLTGAMAAVARRLQGAQGRVVAVDLPSGADPEGRLRVPPDGCIAAGETVTFGVLKPVHLNPAGTPVVGEVTVVDIGLTPPRTATVERLTDEDVGRLWPVPGPGDDKYSRGVLGVVAGSETYPGAAVLCTGAAVRAGAGMVRYLGPPGPTAAVLSAWPEVVPGPGRVQAHVLGPGVPAPYGGGPDGSPDQVRAVEEALDSELPVLVDAGALDVLARRVRDGRLRAAPTLLTPHAGELARLLTVVEGAGVTRAQVEERAVDHARRAARVTGATVLLKGHTTVVADPDPSVPVRSQAEAPAWLATAGAGDVLAGVAGTLLAAGLAPRDAGSLAALVHGRAAAAANPGGPVRALDVAAQVPLVLARLLAR